MLDLIGLIIVVAFILAAMFFTAYVVYEQTGIIGLLFFMLFYVGVGLLIFG